MVLGIFLVFIFCMSTTRELELIAEEEGFDAPEGRGHRVTKKKKPFSPTQRLVKRSAAQRLKRKALSMKKKIKRTRLTTSSFFSSPSSQWCC